MHWCSEIENKGILAGYARLGCISAGPRPEAPKCKASNRSASTVQPVVPEHLHRCTRALVPFILGFSSVEGASEDEVRQLEQNFVNPKMGAAPNKGAKGPLEGNLRRFGNGQGDVVLEIYWDNDCAAGIS